MEADLILFNGRIHTQDPRRPAAEAVAVSGPRIVAVGNSRDIRTISALRHIDLRGRTVTPGFIDSHVHFVLFSLWLQRVKLAGATSREDAVERVRQRTEASPPGEWILGGGWDRNLWADTSFPNRNDLDAVSPRHPVALTSKDVHSIWANSLALHQAGITAESMDPPGGEIVRDAAGRPTGILREKAQELLLRVQGKPSPAAIREAVREGLRRAHSVGVTGFHDCEDEAAFVAFEELKEQGQLDCRVCMQLTADNLDSAIQVGLRSGFGDARLRIGGVKMFADGALGSRSAYLLEPYSGDPDNRGIVVTDSQSMLDLSRRAATAGIHSVIHAIGDAAIRQALDVLQAVRERDPDRLLRHRIEHVQLIHPADVPRMAQLDMIASMQPQHATADIDLVETHWRGERAAGAYAWRTLLDADVRLAFGSDCPVEVLDPLAGIHAAVTRRRPDGYPGPDGWRPEQRLTVEEAVAAYTLGAAHASGEDGVKGAIAPGKLADLVVLSHDIFTIPPMDIAQTRVEATILDGRVVYGQELLA